jgi:hypothetical protein
MLFLVIYVAISFSTYKGIKSVFSHSRYKPLFSHFVTVETIIFLVAFFIFYIWPFNVRNITDYTYHLIFNVLFSIDFVFKLPFTIASLITLLVKRQRRVPYLMAFILSISISISMIYGSIIGKRLIQVNYVTVRSQNLPHSFDNYKLIQLSDIHLGSFNHSKNLLVKSKQIIQKEKPDLILFTGDLVNNFSYETNGWNSYFKDLTAQIPAFSILGNHDYGNYTTWTNEADKQINFNEIVKAHSDFGFVILNNINSKIKKENDSIFVAGVENWGLPPFPQYANLDSAMQNIPWGAFVILLSHDPAHWDNVVKYRDDIDLTLAGHTHGFQWGITKAGIKFSFAWLARKNWGGLYEYDDSKLYVNTGFGAVAIPWRINMSPELTVITLKRVEVD